MPPLPAQVVSNLILACIIFFFFFFPFRHPLHWQPPRIPVGSRGGEAAVSEWSESLASPVTVADARSCMSVWEQWVTCLQLNPTLIPIQSTPTSPWSHPPAFNNPTLCFSMEDMCASDGTGFLRQLLLHGWYLSYTFLSTSLRILTVQQSDYSLGTYSLEQDTVT